MATKHGNKFLQMVNLTEKTRNILIKQAKNQKLSMSKYIEQLILDKEVELTNAEQISLVKGN